MGRSGGWGETCLSELSLSRPGIVRSSTHQSSGAQHVGSMCSPLPWLPRTPPLPVTGGLRSPPASPTDACLPVRMEHKLDMAAAPGTLLCVVACVLTATVTIVARHCAERAGGLSACFSGGSTASRTQPLAFLSSCLPHAPFPRLLPPRPHPPPHRLPSPLPPRGLTFTVPLVLGELEARPAFTGNTPFGCLPANVSAAVVLVHAVHSF